MAVIWLVVMFGFCGYKTHRKVAGDARRGESVEERERKENICVIIGHHGIGTDRMLCKLEWYHLDE